MRQRYYNPEIKRFINQDIITGSIGNSQSLNRYCYVQGNPVSMTDPFGLFPVINIGKDFVHAALNFLGMIPVIGVVADVVNAGLYLKEGDVAGAVSCGISALPGIGDAVAGGMLAVRGAKAAKTARYVKNVSNLIGNGVTFLRCTTEAISGAIDVVSNYIETGEMDWGGLGAVGLNSITAAMSGRAALSSGNALRKALSEDNVAGKIKNSLGNAAGKAKSGVKAFLADNGGYLNLSGKRPDFYVKPNGDAVPATGYRYISEDASYLDVLESSMEIPSNSKGTYFSYNNYDIANPEALQVPHDASIKVSFDTLQIIDDISIPYGKWGQSKSLEPITKDFPEFGLGGATQVITHSNIKVDSITRLPKRQGGH